MPCQRLNRGGRPRGLDRRNTVPLGRYTHRIALTNNRLVNLSDTAVRFRYKDYTAGNRRKVIALDPQEFISRYLLHVLPKALMRIPPLRTSRQSRLRAPVSLALTPFECSAIVIRNAPAR